MPAQIDPAHRQPVLNALDAQFAERPLHGSLLQAFYSIRFERQLMEQLDYNLPYRWFVGLGIDDPVWDH